MTGSSSCQCTTTLHGEKKEIQKDVNTIHRQLRNMLANSLAVSGLSWGLDQKRNGTEPTLTNPTDHGIKLHRKWRQIFAGSGHPIFRASSAFFERGELRSKGGGKKSIHFNGRNENIELFLRTVISANQLGVFGAVADLCNELSKGVRASVKLDAPDHLEKMEILIDLSIAENPTSAQQRGTWCKNTSENSNTCPKTRNYPIYALMRFWSLSKEDNTTILLIQKKGRRHLYREYRMLRNERKTRARGWILKNTRIGPVLDIKVCHHEDQYTIEVQVPSLFQDRTASWVRIVNGVDKYVTESMLTTEEVDIVSGETHSWKQDRGKSQQWRLRPSPFLFVKQDGQTLKHNDQAIKSVLKCRKPSPDCYDMVKQSIEILTEQSSTMTSSQSAGRRR